MAKPIVDDISFSFTLHPETVKLCFLWRRRSNQNRHQVFSCCYLAEHGELSTACALWNLSLSAFEECEMRPVWKGKWNISRAHIAVHTSSNRKQINYRRVLIRLLVNWSFYKTMKLKSVLFQSFYFQVLKTKTEETSHQSLNFVRQTCFWCKHELRKSLLDLNKHTPPNFYTYKYIWNIGKDKCYIMCTWEDYLD